MPLLDSAALLERIRLGLISEACKKNDKLCVGKSPTAHEKNLKMLYSFHKTLQGVTLTQDEIDCVADAIRECAPNTPVKSTIPAILGASDETPGGLVLLGLSIIVTNETSTSATLEAVPANEEGAVSYSWVCVSGCSGSSIVSPAAATTDVTFNNTQVTHFEVTATDSIGKTKTVGKFFYD